MKNINAVELECNLLRVNLTTGAITSELLAEEVVRDFIGGAGLGAKLLYDEVKPGVEAFDPENRLIITTGLVTGTNVPGAAMFNVCTKGPLTDLAASAQANGYFGFRLKQAGYSTLIIEGKSNDWKYLVIGDDKAELKDAEHLAGRNTFETEKIIKDEIGVKKSSVMTIGVGAENLVRYANIQCDEGHFAASNGPGAVMGSKKLKGIAVFGEYKIVPARPEEFRDSVKELVQTILNAPPAIGLSQFGTGMLIPIAYRIGYLPTKNLSEYNWSENVIYDAVAMKKNPAFEFRKNSC